MAFANGPRVFTRTGVEEEEITPPCSKSRSFDSLSVAAILQAKLGEDPAGASAPSSFKVCTEVSGRGFKPNDDSGADTVTPPSPGSPGSPTMAAAAALLSGVGVTHQPSAGMDSAVDCLMNLAGAASVSKAAPTPGKGAKRSASARAAQDATGSGPTRRRLKMRGQPRGSKAAAAAAHEAAAAASALEPNYLCVAGIDAPVAILSDASLTQLKLLAAAFKLCPHPTLPQMAAIGRRVGVSVDKLETWFASRRTLHEWVLQQPTLQPADLAKMFYPGAAESATPPPLADVPLAQSEHVSPLAAPLWPAPGGGAGAGGGESSAWAAAASWGVAPVPPVS